MPTTSFSITSGSTNLKSYSTVHESGLTLKLFFCGSCGSSVYKEAPDAEQFQGVVIVFAGLLDKDEGQLGLEDLKVESELWIKHRVGWLKPMEALPQCQEFA